MAYLYITQTFKDDFDRLGKPIQERVDKTIGQIERDYRHPGLNTKKQFIIRNRDIWRSRVNDNFRLLWEWWQGNIRLWRVAKHDVIDTVTTIRNVPKAEWLFTRDETDQSLVELESLVVSRGLPKPFKYIPKNILRLFGVPDDHLEAVCSVADDQDIWDLPIPDNVRWTLYDILTNPDWTLEDLLDTRQLLYRTTVDQLEGYCEGRIKQLMLNLNEEQQSYVNIRATGPVLIKGVAGSGKTTIGLYRAHELIESQSAQQSFFDANCKRKILLITYTSTLATALKKLYEELYCGIPETVTIRTYDSWMLEQLRTAGIWRNPADYKTRCQLMLQAQREAALSHPSDTVLTQRPVDFLLSEIDDVIRARRINSLDEYKEIERTGRGIRLDRERHRPIVWEIYRRYQQSLYDRGVFDWKDLPRLVQHYCKPLPQYDAVIIDEAQDLSPSHLFLATQLLPNYDDSRTLTLLADPAQSIYYRGIPWKDAGINVTGGRTRLLAKNYRNTVQILEAAKPIVEGCKDLLDIDEYIPPASTEKIGAKPILAQHISWSKRDRFLIEEIMKLCQNGQYRLSDIAILSRNKGLLTKYIQKEFMSRDIPCHYFQDESFDIFENEVKLITMHSAKGLEFPVVFLIGLSDQYMPYIRQDSDTKYEDELQERKLFYVSMTRAAERLYLLHPQRDRCRFLRDLDPSTIRELKL